MPIGVLSTGDYAMDFWAGIEQIKSDYKVFCDQLLPLNKAACMYLLERSDELCLLKRRLQDMRQVLPADESHYQAEYRWEQMMSALDKKLAKLQEAIGNARKRESDRNKLMQTLERQKKTLESQGKRVKARDIDDRLVRLRARIAS